MAIRMSDLERWLATRPELSDRKEEILDKAREAAVVDRGQDIIMSGMVAEILGERMADQLFADLADLFERRTSSFFRE